MSRVSILALALALIVPLAANADDYAGTARVLDGDTIAIGSERIRLSGIDAPESWKSRCPAELAIALRAKDRLRELLAAGPVRIERHGRDRYRRTLARVYAADGREAGAVLVAEGLAVAWKPGKAAWAERARHWCPGFVEETGQ